MKGNVSPQRRVVRSKNKPQHAPEPGRTQPYVVRAVAPSPHLPDPGRAHRAKKRYWVKGLRP
jgi:hypothetical protein